MAEPTNPIIIVAQSDVILPSGGTNNKIAPIGTYLTTGWDVNQGVPAENLNYIWNNHGQWLKYVNEEKIPNSVSGLQQQIESNDTDISNLQEQVTQLNADKVPKTTKVNSKELSGDITLNSSDISGATTTVTTGELEAGSTIPLPNGFTRDQCKYMVSIANSNSPSSNPHEGSMRVQFDVSCSVDQSTGVTSGQTKVYDQESGSYKTSLPTLSYMCIAVK